MDTSSNFGIFCLLPPFIAIVLALKTKQTLFSLFIAIWVGATMLNGFNPIIGFTKIVSDFMIPAIANKWNAGMLILVSMAGGLKAILQDTGAAQAFANIMSKKINNATKGQLITWASAFVFSYTEPCLILGTLMRPLTDAVKVSRAKLAYILDSMGCNLASFSPICSYGPFITGLIAAQFVALKYQGNEWGVWVRMLPFNLYGLFAMITVLVVALSHLDFGPMYMEEKRARETGLVIGEGVIPLVPEKNVIFPDCYKLSTWNFIIPFMCLFGGIFLMIFWTGDVMKNGILGSFNKGNITLSICIGFMMGGIGAGAMGVIGKLFTPAEGFNHYVDGIAEMIFVPFILIMAWCIGNITSQMHVGPYMASVVKTYLSPSWVPAMVFIFGAIISFATGSSWGVWSIMIPIALPMALTFNISIPYTIGAVISGGLFGDQCSPISDTTILSSTGASCNHIVHVETQLPYGITVAIAAFIGFLFGGFTKLYIVSIFITALVLVCELIILHLYTRKHNLKIVDC
jgi:Na+/H+ antiporter NhaC